MAEVERVPGHFDAVARRRPLVLGVLSMEVGVLAVTGVILYFVYRPSSSEAWIQMTDGDRPMGLPEWTRLLHRWIALLTVPTALVAGLLSSRRLVIRRRWPGPAAAAALLVALLAALATGFRLPWDQLALWAVTRGENYVGYGPLLAGDVRFVVTDRGEEAPSTIIIWLVVHALVGVVAGGLVAVAWRIVRRRGLSPASGSLGGTKTQPLQSPPDGTA